MVGKTLRELVIDDMKTGDLNEVLEIERASFATPWSEQLFRSEIYKPKSLSKVARLDQRIIGYMCAHQIIDEGHILDLAVHPAYRRIGIASALIGHVIDCLKNNNCVSIFLEVRASNKIARTMYAKFNFKVLGIRKNYYRLPVEDAVVMVLKVDR